MTIEPSRAEVAPADQIATLTDGRRLAYRTYGDPQGAAVIALHGTPGSRFKYAGSHAAALRSGIRLIALDRWGYGGSSPHSHGRLADFGTDMTELADQLKLGRCGITGVSGGAPFAVAAAAALGPRVTGLALVAPVGPITGPAGTAALSPFHALCFRLLPRVPGATGTVFHLYRAGLTLAPKLAMGIAMSHSAADREGLRDAQTCDQLIETFRAGLEPGVDGPRTDMAVFAKPWGIDLPAITAPVRIWIGSADRNVPMAAVHALVHAVPGCELTLLPGAGHLWVARNASVIMDWLAGQSQGVRAAEDHLI